MTEVAHLIRNPEKVHEALTETPDGKLVAKATIKIQIPTRYVDKGIATIGETIYIPGFFGIIVDDRYYGVSKALSYLPVTPVSLQEVKIGETKYLEMRFDKGDVICPNINLMKKDTYVYGIWEELVSQGKHPWYFNSIDHSEILATSEEHGGVRLVANSATMEFITAYLTRDAGDIYTQFRHKAKGWEDLVDPERYTVLALNDVAHVAPNTLSKITGAYLDSGLTSALIDPSDNTDQAEEIYRMNIR